MNPYSVNVELYHNKFSSSSDPRDLLSPTVNSRPAKVHPLLKLLGTLANQKTCAVAVGGIVVISSIHVVRKGMKWFRRKRSSTNIDNEVELSSNHHERGTQTEAPENHLISLQGSPLTVNAISIGETCNFDESDPNVTVGRSLSTVPSSDVDRSQVTKISSTKHLDTESSLTNEAAHKQIACGCQCSRQKRAGRQSSQYTQPMHPLCRFSIVMALLALQKASSCETQNAIANACDQQTACQEEDVSPIGRNSLFHPGAKKARTNPKKNGASLIMEESNFKIGEVRKSDSDHPKKYISPSTPHFPWPQAAKPRSSSPQSHFNTMKTQKSETRETQSGLQLEANASGNSFSGQSSASKKTSDNNVSTDTRNFNMSSAQKQEKRRKNVAGSSAEKPKQEGSLQQKRKPKRRGGRRGRNARRQQYVDLDNPNQVAS